MIAFLVASAFAQDPNVQPNIQHFHPTGSTQGFAVVRSARQLPQFGFGGDAVLQYAHRPFQRSMIGEDGLVRDAGAVDGLLAAHLRMGFGLTDWLEASVRAPVFQFADTGDGIEDFGGVDSSVGFGDVTVELQATPVTEDVVGISLVPFVTLPSGARKLFLTHGVVTAGGHLVLSKTVDPVHLAASVGYRFVPSANYLDTEIAVDDAVLYNAGIGFILKPDQVRLNLEADGELVVGAARGLVAIDEGDPSLEYKAALHSPLEILADIRIQSTSGFGALFGGGPGITPAVGTPQFRLFAGITYSPPKDQDTDGDGYLDKNDDCPNDPEDFDDFQDEDGCPEFDNDQDGIADMVDRCPNQPEDVDGFQDPDGCPDPDNDQDRILDVADACPMQPEDYDGIDDLDGCPDAELVIDTDKDGLLDPVDQCPYEPEDFDGFQDEDGCPDPDNDQDQILDPNDLCPNEPENYNGVKDDDGCPDAQRVVVTRDQIVILDKVLFYTAKAKIVPESFPILEEVLQVLLDQPRILKVRIEGHTDSRGSESYNLDLSNKRANAIRDFLVERGVEPGRLSAEGFGELSPLVPNDTAENLEKNRRVEFHILEQTK